MSLLFPSLVGVARAAALAVVPDVVVDAVAGKPTCLCPADPDLDRLRDLIRQGFGQVEASLMLWGAPVPVQVEPPVYGASRLSWTIWMRLEARRQANRARRSLGFPELPETAESVMF